VHDLVPAHQRAGQDLREEGDVERVADEVEARRAAGLEVDQVHDVVEGEERDAERQRDVEPRRGGPEDRFKNFGEEVEILEKP